MGDESLRPARLYIPALTWLNPSSLMIDTHTHTYANPREDPVPLVIVEGFLGGPGAVLWGDFEQSLNKGSSLSRKIIFTTVGPVSSLHDRACELYYALMGGPVDYGEGHAKLHGHLRYGRVNTQALYPQWSLDRPLHFLGHSMGGATIIKLQFLLHQGYFGSNGHSDMILSVNTISAPFRGTQLTYILGERTDAAPAVRPLSVGSMVAKCVHLLAFLSPVLPRSLNLHSESRSLSFYDMSLLSLLKQLWRSDWAESRDASPFDATFEAADQREASSEGLVYSRTFYRSQASCMASLGTDRNYPILDPSVFSVLSNPLRLLFHLIRTFDCSTLKPAPSFIQSAPEEHSSFVFSTNADVEKNLHNDREWNWPGAEYQVNDGIVPLFSQWHPFPCSLTKCRHLTPMDNTNDRRTTTCEDQKMVDLDPGIWHVHQMEDANHISIVPYWTGDSRQRCYWESLGLWLRGIDIYVSTQNWSVG